MEPTSQAEGIRRLAPLVLDDESVDRQMRRRFGASVVATSLFVSLQLFFLVLFTGFGRWKVGLVLALGIVPIVAWIWWGHLRLRRAVTAYRLVHPSEPPDPSHWSE